MTFPWLENKEIEAEDALHRGYLEFQLWDEWMHSRLAFTEDQDEWEDISYPMKSHIYAAMVDCVEMWGED